MAAESRSSRQMDDGGGGTGGGQQHYLGDRKRAITCAGVLTSLYVMETQSDHGEERPGWDFWEMLTEAGLWL